jgi:NAD(P)-dependent dehydrogenase (short-subunit alcohol dehydrogenase family)
VTGGTSGIGLATAQALAAQGVDVVITGRDEERGLIALDALAGHAGRSVFVPGDVAIASDVTRAFEAADRAFGRVDFLFNNAGVAAVGPIDQLDEAAWDACIDTNLKGTYLASRAAIPRMRAVGGGVIVNNSSNAGLQARARDPVYGASKAGLNMLTKGMALTHAADRIRGNAVCPGPVAGPAYDLVIEAAVDPAAELRMAIEAAPLAAAMGRMIEPREVAAVVVFLCSDEAAMITGAIVAVDAGKSAGIPR